MAGSGLRLPFRLPLPGVYIEPGPNTPEALRLEIEWRRAATVLPIPYRPPADISDRREAAMVEEAKARGWTRP